MRPAAFLDRDGTIVEDVGYLDRTERLALYPWTADALRLLARAGFALIVVTNQSGVARGLFPESRVRDVHSALDRRLARGGARLDAYYYCPHYPDGTDAAYRRECECRKPRPGMILQAAREHDLDLSRSFVVGDKWTDVALAAQVGARGVLVGTGSGTREAKCPPPAGMRADAIVPHLAAAASWILLQR
jgi:D-glycero-D-manno-heptose 1,7-bisphosphate phosphatase